MSGYPTDPKYKPLTAWNYFGLQLLFSVPVIGFIFLIIFAISPKNINRRSFARSYFCYYLVVAVIMVILVATGLFGIIMDAMSK